MLKNIFYVAAGFGIGYFVAEKNLRARYDARADREIAAAKTFYKSLYEEDLKKLEGTRGDVEEAVVALKTYQTGKTELPEENNTSTVVPMIRPAPESVEEKGGPAPPYIIPFDSFDESMPDYDKNTVEYFSGDGVVTDWLGEIVSTDSVEKLIGSENLKRLSDGTPTIYVRCEKYRQDFEVILKQGRYSDEIG